MQSKNVLLCALILMVMTAACSPEAEVLPTVAPQEATEEPTPLPTATPLNLQRPTLPPTWTPSPDPNSVTQPEATTGADSSGQAQQLATQSPAFAAATPLEVCTGFGEDRERNKRTFKIGESPQVFWTAVAGAGSYSISLIDETETVLLTEYTTEPTYTFDASLFEQSKFYGWEAYPIDMIGQQMCLGRGAELFPEDPLVVTQAS